MRRYLLRDIATFAYILLFSFVAASKLMDMEKFAAQMRLQPLNASLVPYLIWGIPIVEVLIVLVLSVPGYRIVGLKLAMGLMLVFTGYISLANFGYFVNPPCTCAGVISTFTWNQHLWFNLFFLILGVVAILPPFEKKSLKLN
ncbi:hypothetical protein SAMN04488128_10881 [Chitinophaga eiseniae]|uniref:Methylamine utilisation protein MauE domain-containing protein n=1 Tax=Chitinophaga eiseniae TaxID=634771 RepID=A0A1T4U2W5_9BACT|nr:MauE/DoxX family redox-associated membrane protein [Chitinophaga eiseniae]SKA47046.1 hypothetical protein SAMN04488128_10881 [Chitinophaga eiseniae]